MGEILEIFKEKYLKSNDGSSKEIMEKQKIKNELMGVCETLKDPLDVLMIEVSPKNLGYVLEVIMEEPLISSFSFSQVSETMFAVQLREIEL